MNMYDLANCPSPKSLISAIRNSSDPVIVSDGQEECFIAMHPAVFEQILFQNDALICTNRSTLHL